MNELIMMIGLMCGGENSHCVFSVIPIESGGNFDKSALLIEKGRQKVLIKTTQQCCGHYIEYLPIAP